MTSRLGMLLRTDNGDGWKREGQDGELLQGLGVAISVAR